MDNFLPAELLDFGWLCHEIEFSEFMDIFARTYSPQAANLCVFVDVLAVLRGCLIAEAWIIFIFHSNDYKQLPQTIDAHTANEGEQHTQINQAY